MSKGLEKLYRLETAFPLNNRGQSVYREYTNSVTPYYEDFNVVEKELKAFDIIKENFDIEVIVINDYCYIEITSKICEMSKTQRAIKINPENKNKVEALKEVLKNDNPQE